MVPIVIAAVRAGFSWKAAMLAAFGIVLAIVLRRRLRPPRSAVGLAWGFAALITLAARKRGIKPILGHSMPLATIGVFLLFLGWFGFNGGSVLSAAPEAVSLVFVTTALAAAAGLCLGLDSAPEGIAEEGDAAEALRAADRKLGYLPLGQAAAAVSLYHDGELWGSR